MKNKVFAIFIILGALIFFGCSHIEYITKEVQVPIYIPEKADTITLIDTVDGSDVYWFGNIADSLGRVNSELKVYYNKKIAELKQKSRIDTVTVTVTDTVYKDRTSVVEVISGLLPLWAEIVFIAIGLVLLALSNKNKLSGLFKNVKSI